MSTLSPWGENSLIGDLLETLESDPSSIEARRILIDQYITLDWNEAAVDLAREILSLQPDDPEALGVLQNFADQPSAASGSQRRAAKAPAPSHPPRRSVKLTGTEALILEQGVQHLKEQYESLREEAEEMLRELLVFQEMAPDLNCLEQLADLDALTKGKMFTVARRQVDKNDFDTVMAMSSVESGTLLSPSKAEMKHAKRKDRSTRAGRGFATVPSSGITAPQSARSLAQAMKTAPLKALDIAVSDFEAVIHWQKTVCGTTDEDALHSLLRRRVDAVKSALPKTFSHIPNEAFMHAEHEHLDKTYLNTETMIGGDPISSIRRDHFWVSEDGYAWDMEELVAAIKASNGSLRNPLSKEPFSASDVEAIVRHPLGSSIAAVQIAQAKLKKGVRPETITRLQTMARILLSDNSENSFPSHQAVDDFLGYVATLPTAEREAIDKLKVPAVDSHTRQPFDDTIGDAVRDAKGNRICFHKAGDLLKQAAEHLSRS